MKLFSLRNVALVSVAAVTLSYVSFSTAGSYLRTATDGIARQVKEAVPLDFELRRLEKLTTEMIPEIQANQKVAAQLDVEIEYLQRELQELADESDESRQQMRRLRDSLACNPNQPCEFGGRSYTAEAIAHDLERRLTAWKDLQLRREAKNRLLVTRQRTLDSAVAKIHACRHQHTLLTEKAETLRGELKLLELAQATGNVSFDDTRLQQAKTLSADLEKRIRVLHRLCDGDHFAPAHIPVELDRRSIVERFDEAMSACPARSLARK